MYTFQVLLIYFYGCLFSVQLVLGQYQIPDPTIEAFSPKGFKIQIPNEVGIKKVGFHIKVNEEFTHQTQGSLYKVANELNKDEVWEFRNDDLMLKIGDIVYYWMFVQVDGIGYRKSPNKWTIQELITLPDAKTSETEVPQPETPNGECLPSVTISNDRHPCRGKLLFEEYFNETDLKRNVWKHEHYIPREIDYEFVSYQNSKNNIFIENGLLHIKPTLLSQSPTKSTTPNTLDLITGCTRKNNKFCYLQAKSYNILPPIISGKITTKESFSFQYGKIEIRAKFPAGDWIYPQLFLLPKSQSYGSDYESGAIAVAMAHGNEELRVSLKNINMDSNELYSGMILGKEYPLRSYAMKKFRTPDGISWNKNFHVYSLTWKPGSVTMAVNNKTFGTFQPPDAGFSEIRKQLNSQSKNNWNSPQAPFDKEFYISLSVAVGGINEFPDDVLNKGRGKPWRNEDPKYLLHFWNDKDNWYSTWNKENSDLQIDYIKVWAI